MNVIPRMSIARNGTLEGNLKHHGHGTLACSADVNCLTYMAKTGGNECTIHAKARLIRGQWTVTHDGNRRGYPSICGLIGYASENSFLAITAWNGIGRMPPDCDANPLRRKAQVKALLHA